MGKNRHSKDRLYLTTTEWATEYGGKKNNVNSNQGSKPLPFDHCALSLGHFETPCCTSDGVIFDLMNLVPYIRKYKCNPITGESMSSQDIIRLNMNKDAEGHWCCPITCKVFNNNTHVVAIKTTGNVFSFDAVNELNIKRKNYVDLLTSEPFSKHDIITLQDPTNLEHMAKRDINNFIHLKKIRDDNNINMNSSSSSSSGESESLLVNSKIRSNPISQKIMKEIELNKKNDNEENQAKKRLLEQVSHDDEFVDDVADLMKLYPLTNAVNPGQVSTTGKASSSFTSSSMSSDTSSDTRLATPNELRDARWRKMRELDKKAHVQLQTTHGNLNLEIHCNWSQRTSWNFLTLCQRGYYDNMEFHRLIPGFMIQTGDPATRTGAPGTAGTATDESSGESAFGHGEAFKDEFDSRLSHNERGVLSMANSGRNTNKSQFFITFQPVTYLDNKHTIFGKVVGGLTTLDRMESVDIDKKNKPIEKIILLKTIVFTNPIPEADQLLLADIEKNIKNIQSSQLRSALPKSAATTAVTTTAAAKSTSNNYSCSDRVNVSTIDSALSSFSNVKMNNVVAKPAIATATTSAVVTADKKAIQEFLKSQTNPHASNQSVSSSAYNFSTSGSSSSSSNSQSVTSTQNAVKKAKTEKYADFSGW